MNTVILAISAAFLEPGSFMGEAEEPGTGESRGDTPPASLVLLKTDDYVNNKTRYFRLLLRGKESGVRPKKERKSLERPERAAWRADKTYE